MPAASLPDGIDAEVAEGFEVWEWDAADGSCAVEAFWAEVRAVVLEDLVNEVLGADGHAGREVADAESEYFGQAQSSTACQFGPDGISVDGLLFAMTGHTGGGEEV